MRRPTSPSQIEVLKPGLYSLEKATPTPVPVTGRKFAGSETTRQGINGLAVADDVTMVIVPDLVTAATKADGSLDLGLWKAVQTSLISHCEQNGNRMAVLDAPPGMTPQQIRDWRSDVAMYDSAYAALYYPWIKVENPIGVNGDAEVLHPAERAHRRRLGAHRRDPRGLEGAGQRHHPRLPGCRLRRHPERTVGAQSDRHQLHSAVRHPRHPDLGRTHAGQ